MFLQDRQLHEECGVFAVCGYEHAAAMCYYGLHSLQHRGQEAAGIVVKDHEALSIQKVKVWFLKFLIKKKLIR